MFRPIYFAFAVSALLLPAHIVFAFDVNDCIINGMKGVSSDVAARQVRQACDQKLQQHRRQRLAQLTREYGEAMNTDLLVSEKYFNTEGPGLLSNKFTNRSADRTVGYVRLKTYPAPGGAGTNCDTSKERIHAYKVTMKPGESVNFLFPSSTEYNCIFATTVLGRAPSWKDVSFSATAKPLDKDPFAEMGLD